MVDQFLGPCVDVAKSVELVEHPLRFYGIDPSDRDPRVHQHVITDCGIWHACHVVFAADCGEFNLGAGKERIAVDPANNFSGNR